VHSEKPISPELDKDMAAFEQIQNIFATSDINVINLETAITSRSVKREKQYNFKSNLTFLQSLKEMGVSIASVANNHSYDYGREGFLDTLENLDTANLPYIGGGANQEEAYRAYTVNVRGVKIAFLAFAKVNGGAGSLAVGSSPGTTDGYNEILVKNAVVEADKQADYVVVLAHWGEENKLNPREREINSGKSWLGYGADLIVGSHPHVIQPIKVVGDKVIAYSLGNFIFYSHNKINRETGVLQIKLNSKGKFKNYTMIKMEINSKTGMPTVSGR